MNQVEWPVLSLVLLFNMFITGTIGLCTGLIGGWVGHLLATSRDKKARKWQELNYWRNIFEGHLKEVQQIARVSLALNFVYSDNAERNISIFTLASNMQ